ncbi:MAG: hypothetical protein OXE85_00180 [Roseovarius sp.]|nr:hypothetical protein [Roseovarius sp.]
MEDPCQALNAVKAGGFTDKAEIDDDDPEGYMSPALGEFSSELFCRIRTVSSNEDQTRNQKTSNMYGLCSRHGYLSSNLVEQI